MVSQAAKERNGNFLFMAAGLVMVVYAAVTLIRQHSSAGWPATEGHIVDHDVRPATLEHGKRKKSGFAAFAAYAYEVEGRSYESDRYAIGQEHVDKHAMSLDAKRALRAEYPLKQEVTVYYDPDDPASAVLKAGAPEWNGTVYLLGGVGLIAFVYCLLQQLGVLKPDEDWD